MRLSLLFCLGFLLACTTAAPATAPNVICSGNSQTCSCSVDPSAIKAGSGHCSPSDVGGAGSVCCAGSAWPSQGSCLCKAPIHCYAKTTAGCYCADSQGSASDTAIDVCQPPSGGQCCLDKASGSCACGAAVTCPTSGTMVASCDAPSTTSACSSGNHPVDKCQ